MEAPVGGELGGDVARRSAASTQSRGRELDPRQRVRRRAPAARARAAPLLEQRAQRVDLLEVVDPQLGDEVAAARQVGDLALLLEHAQRLAHRARR